jgi:predicted metal-dependent enzyme (double-stranded beta helix superfamily)
VAQSYGGKDHTYCLKVFIWPPSTETKIHDHSSWGVYCCAVGSVLEERYERLDNGSRSEHARLKENRQRMWSKQGRRSL